MSGRLESMGAISLGKLDEAWQPMHFSKIHSWREVRGPMGSMWLILKRVGWSWVAPFKFQTELVVELDANRVPLGLLKLHLEQGWQRKAERAVGQITDDANLQGQRICLDVAQNGNGGRRS